MRRIVAWVAKEHGLPAEEAKKLLADLIFAIADYEQKGSTSRNEIRKALEGKIPEINALYELSRPKVKQTATDKVMKQLEYTSTSEMSRLALVQALTEAAVLNGRHIETEADSQEIKDLADMVMGDSDRLSRDKIRKALDKNGYALVDAIEMKKAENPVIDEILQAFEGSKAGLLTKG